MVCDPALKVLVADGAGGLTAVFGFVVGKGRGFLPDNDVSIPIPPPADMIHQNHSDRGDNDDGGDDNYEVMLLVVIVVKTVIW